MQFSHGFVMSMAFSGASLPAAPNAINRYEELIAWAVSQSIADIGAITDLIQLGQVPSPVARIQTFTNAQGEQRLECLVYLKLEDDWFSNGKPIHKSVVPYPVS